MAYNSRGLVIYIFQATKRTLGGLGDRVAGLITAVSFAIRTNRNFRLLMEDFSEGESPFLTQINLGRFDDTIKYYNKSVRDLSNCINPSNVSCALDADIEEKVILYASNRAYLCRWASDGNTPAHQQLQTIGISYLSNLHEAAGCMLRVGLRPSPRLWESVDKLLPFSNQNKIKYQIGIHFRCGDMIFTKENSCMKEPRLCCPRIPSPFKITDCATGLMKKHNAKSTRIPSLFFNEKNYFIYVTSDNIYLGKEISKMLSSYHTFTTPSSCHIDFGNKSLDCFTTTIVHWFVLSLSDHIIAQSNYIPPTDEDYMLHRPRSAFSKYASMYGLRPAGLRLETNCRPINMSRFYHTSSGNWVCSTGSKLL